MKWKENLFNRICPREKKKSFSGINLMIELYFSLSIKVLKTLIVTTLGPSVYERSYSASASSSNTIPVASSRNNRAGDRNSSCNSADRNNSYVVGFQKRSNSNDFSNGGGGGNDKNTPYVPRGPLHYCDVCKISCAGPQTYKVRYKRWFLLIW